MTPGQLVKAAAIALDVPEETMVQHDRNLSVAGLRTKGARGVNAPDVTPLDAARLLVATLASSRIKDSVETIRKFEKAKFTPPQEADLQAARELIVTWRARGYISNAEETAHLNRKVFSDPAVTALGPEHNFLRALAALIADASAPNDDLDGYYRRFAPIHISCEIPAGRATISRFRDLTGAIYVPKDAADPNVPGGNWHGIRQQREVRGTAIILLGRAFREDGLPVKTTSIWQSIRQRYDDLCERVEQENEKELARLEELRAELNEADRNLVDKIAGRVPREPRAELAELDRDAPGPRRKVK
jgi:hypothetical protein